MSIENELRLSIEYQRKIAELIASENCPSECIGALSQIKSNLSSWIKLLEYTLESNLNLSELHKKLDGSNLVNGKFYDMAVGHFSFSKSSPEIYELIDSNFLRMFNFVKELGGS